MRFLLDVCASSRTLTDYLSAQGRDVVTVLSIDAKASDEKIMDLALREHRILIAEDKDFGELIFVQKLPHGPIVRVVELSVDNQASGIRELLDRHAAELTGSVIVTLTRDRIRIRRNT